MCWSTRCDIQYVSAIAVHLWKAVLDVLVLVQRVLIIILRVGNMNQSFHTKLKMCSTPRIDPHHSHQHSKRVTVIHTIRVAGKNSVGLKLLAYLLIYTE